MSTPLKCDPFSLIVWEHSNTEIAWGDIAKASKLNVEFIWKDFYVKLTGKREANILINSINENVNR